jgi:hypothetical protein
MEILTSGPMSCYILKDRTNFYICILLGGNAGDGTTELHPQPSLYVLNQAFKKKDKRIKV